MDVIDSPPERNGQPRSLVCSGSGELLGSALTWLRWTLLGAVFAVTLVWPLVDQIGLPVRVLILILLGYNLLVELLRRQVPRLHSFAWVPVTDLVMAGLVYALDGEPAGPLFVAFYLGAITAAICWSLPAALGFAAVTVTVILMISPTLPGWSSGPISLRVFASRIVVLLIFAGGTAFMSRRFARQEELAKSLRSEADRFKEWSELGASLSHDLRTPLTALQASLGLLETSASDQLQPEERELLTNARRNVGRLRLQIDDLLTANQIHTGTIQIDREPIDLRDVVADAMEVVRYSMSKKGQVLEADLPEPLPATGDARRLEQVVINLLDNAHLHTPKGSRVTVTGQVVDGESQLVVADDGPGIPPEEHEHIFQRFYRRGHSRGSGLGLAVSRNIIELHNGRLWVASQPGHGAAFHVALPTREGSATA